MFPRGINIDISIADEETQFTNHGCAYRGYFDGAKMFLVPNLVFEPFLFALVAYKASIDRSQQAQGDLMKQITGDRYAQLQHALCATALDFSRFQLYLSRRVRISLHVRAQTFDDYPAESFLVS